MASMDEHVLHIAHLLSLNIKMLIYIYVYIRAIIKNKYVHLRAINVIMSEGWY